MRRKKVLQENPRQIPPKYIQQKSPTRFCRGAGPTKDLKSLRFLVAIWASKGSSRLRQAGGGESRFMGDREGDRFYPVLVLGRFALYL